MLLPSVSAATISQSGGTIPRSKELLGVVWVGECFGEQMCVEDNAVVSEVVAGTGDDLLPTGKVFSLGSPMLRSNVSASAVAFVKLKFEAWGGG